MKYVAVHSIEVGQPALENKLTGEPIREANLKTLQAGDEVPKMEQAETDRLLAIGAIVPGNSPAAQALTMTPEQIEAESRRVAAEQAEAAAVAAKAKAEADAKAKADKPKP